MADASEVPDRLLLFKEVSHRVGLGRTMIYRLMRRGEFPRQYAISPNTVRWSEREIVAWIAEVKDGFEGKRRRW